MIVRSLIFRCRGSGAPPSPPSLLSRHSTGGHIGGPPAPVTITVKDTHNPDFTFSLTWPPQPSAAPASGEASSTRSAHSTAPAGGPGDDGAAPSAAGGTYTSTPRSPYSVLRSRRTLVNRCAMGALHGHRVAQPVALRASASAFAGGCGGGATSRETWCCCSALLYPTTTTTTSDAASQPAAETAALDARLRDGFVLGLRVSQGTTTLRSILGEAAFARLVGPALATAGYTAALCADPVPLFQDAAAHRDEADRLAECDWTARPLLSADEESRIQWLREESGDLSGCYARAPTLRALFVMWSMVAAQGAGADEGAGPLPPPSLTSIEQVYERMRAHGVRPSLCDLGALIALAEATEPSMRHLVMGLLLRLVKPESIARLTAGPELPRAALEIILVLTSLCRFAHRLRDARGERPRRAEAEAAAADSERAAGAKWEDGARSSHREMSSEEAEQFLLLVRVAARVGDARAELERALVGEAGNRGGGANDGTTAPPSAAPPHVTAMLELMDAVVAETRAVAHTCELSGSSEHLSEVAAWLLRTMPSSPVCARHYQFVVDHSPSEALLLLERSGLLGQQYVDLSAVLNVVLPLVEQCGSEDFFSAVVREVIGLLEDRLRRDPQSFTDADLRCIAEFGTRLCSTVSPTAGGLGGSGACASGAGFDAAAREQMEELHVMDGSPWALCVSSYRSLKAMVQNLVRDNRRLKRQLQEQMRSLATGVAAAGDGLLRSAGAQGRGRGGDVEAVGRAGEDGGELASTVGEGGGHDSGVAAAPAGGAAGSVPGAPAGAHVTAGSSRLTVSPAVRQRFLLFVEDLVKELVDESASHAARPIVVNSELFTFINRHVPVPNIQDEYRRKIFLLVNVAEDPEALRRRRSEQRRQKQLAEQRRSQEAEERQRQRLEAGGQRAVRRQQLRLELLASLEKAFAVKSAAARRGKRWGLPLGGVSGAAEGEGRDTDVDLDGDLRGGAEEIPTELRFLVSSLPLTLSPWASVMILREVLAESAGRNPRYTYVLNAAIDLQLPISTTRSRIATTLNMWRFLNSQSHKLSLKESVVMKQRCVFNLPLSYILSSYWSLLTWTILASIVLLNVVGIDFESQLVANSLCQKFAPWEEVLQVPIEPWNAAAAADLASSYFEQDEIASKYRSSARRSSDVLVSSASYLFLGYDDQRRPMTLIPISSAPQLSEEERGKEEFASAAAVLRELSLHAPFPFYIDIERPMSVEYVEMRVAERIRRVSNDNTWFLPRMIIRTFPLGRRYTEKMLISHTCSQANLTRRRITFLIYVDDGVAVTQQFLRGLQESVLAQSANLVVVVHERSLSKGGTTPRAVDALAAGNGHDADRARLGGMESTRPTAGGSLRVLPYCRQLCDTPEGFFRSSGAVLFGPHRDGRLGDGRGYKWAGPHGRPAHLTASKNFSPFAQHFGLCIPAPGEEAGRHHWTVEDLSPARGGSTLSMSDGVGVVVGATFATANLLTQPLYYTFGLARSFQTQQGSDGVASEELTKREAGPHEGQASPSLHSRPAFTVPVAAVREVMEMTASTGQSAMRWLVVDGGQSCPSEPPPAPSEQPKGGWRSTLGGAWGSVKRWWSGSPSVPSPAPVTPVCRASDDVVPPSGSWGGRLWRGVLHLVPGGVKPQGSGGVGGVANSLADARR